MRGEGRLNQFIKSGFRYILMLLLILSASCGSAETPPPTSVVPRSTFTFPPTSTSFVYPTVQTVPTAPVIQQQWFSENFDQGMPSNWIATSGWTTSPGSLLAIDREQTFRIPGEWTDFTLHIRLMVGNAGWSSVGFRNRDDNYYQLSFDGKTIILSRHDSGQVQGHRLQSNPMTISDDWHDLVVRAAGTKLTASWDGQAIISYVDDEPLAGGDLFVQNWDNTLYKVDLVEVSPADAAVSTSSSGQDAAGGGSQPSNPQGGGTAGSAETTVTAGPPPQRDGGTGGKITDLALSNARLDARNSLWGTLANLGPDAFNASLEIDCTIWYQINDTGSTMGIGTSTNPTIVLEPGQVREVQTPCSLDSTRGKLAGLSISLGEVPTDPDPTNNSASSTP